MANNVVPGTIAAEAGSMTRAILDVFESLLDPAIFAASETGLKRFSNAIAVGVCGNIVASITDTNYLQVDGGEIVGGVGGGGGGAPDNAEYLVAASNGTLTAERVATNTTTVTWDFATPGQAKANVAAGTVSPASHASTHENLGSDEIDVTGLSGLLADPQTPVPTAGADTTAIHDNVAGEINAITSKTSPVADDVAVIEDSADTFSKKKVTLAAILDARPATVYELDWSAEANQTITSNGAYAVDGNNWTSANYADASVFRIQNGSGLEITANAGVSKTWTGSTNTAPAFYCDIQTLAAEAAKYNLALTIWSYFSAYSCPNSANAIIAGAYATTTGGYTASFNGSGYINNGVNTYPLQQRAGTTFNAATIQATTTDVTAWKILPGHTTEVYCGTWAGDWPALSDMTLYGVDSQPQNSTTTVTVIFRRPDVMLLYSPATRAASGAPSFTLARTRIQIG